MRHWIWQHNLKPNNWERRFARRKEMFTFSFGLPLGKHSPHERECQKGFKYQED